MSFVRQKLMRVASGSSGSTLVGVAALVIILSITAAGLIMVVTSASRNETIALNDTRAFLAAESGLLLGAKWINDSTNWWKDVYPLDKDEVVEDIIPDLNINNFNVNVDLVRTDSGVIINSKALCSSEIGYDKMVSQDAEPIIGQVSDTSFDNAILCDNIFTFNGTGNIQGEFGEATNIHSNDTIKLIGNVSGADVHITSSKYMYTTSQNLTINGSGKSPDFGPKIDSSTFTMGYEVGAVPQIPIPDIDLLPWFYEALANGEVHNGFSKNSDYTPDGGVVWVNGDANLGGQSTFNGTLIATGDVTLIGGASVIGPEDGLAIASVFGNIKHSSNGTIEGLVYAKNGDFNITGNGTLTGQVIAKGGIDMGGNPGAITYNKTIILHPDPPDAKGCVLVMGTWWEKNI